MALSDSDKATVMYVDGHVSQKLLDNKCCMTCFTVISGLLNHGQHTSTFLRIRDFSNSVFLEPIGTLQQFFFLVYMVFLSVRNYLAKMSCTQNLLNDLSTVTYRQIQRQDFVIPFCHKHLPNYTNFLIRCMSKTCLKGFAQDVNEAHLKQKQAQTISNKQKMKILRLS